VRHLPHLQIERRDTEELALEGAISCEASNIIWHVGRVFDGLERVERIPWPERPGVGKDCLARGWIKMYRTLFEHLVCYIAIPLLHRAHHACAHASHFGPVTKRLIFLAAPDLAELPLQDPEIVDTPEMNQFVHCCSAD